MNQPSAISDTARDSPLLDVRDLRVQFGTDEGLVKAVDGVSFQLHRGETLGIVGESGSGKSVTNLALLGLIPTPPGIIAGGQAMYRGEDLLTMNAKKLTRVRGNRIAMIFQDPMTSLNPFLTVAEQLTEVTIRHLGHSAEQALEHAIEMLRKVGIGNAEQRVTEYPHQFSGGMRQRVMIAMALACKPDILIADEPTTALDVTIQAQILELMKELQQTEGTAIIMITHDMGVIANICHRVHVMYAGRIIEEADIDPLFSHPQHPYTEGLLHSIPRMDRGRDEPLNPIEGQPPHLVNLPPGCAFEPRCPLREDICRQQPPPMFRAAHGGRHACFVRATEPADRENSK